MNYIKLGKTDILVSKLSLGTWEMGGDTVWSDESDEESIRIIREAGDKGINFIDTAPLYGHGHSEELIAEALGNHRKEFVIATKGSMNWENRGHFEFERDGAAWCTDFTANGLRRDLEGSLKRLNTDYIDVYYTHRDIPEAYLDEAMDTLKRFKREGKIRAIGLSNMTRPVFDRFYADGCLDAIEMKYSLLDPEYGDQYFELCHKGGITFQAFSVLARGILTGRLKADTIVENQAHQKFGWFEMARRADLMSTLEQWRQTYCKKYHCSLASLALAWTMKRSEEVSVLFGVRRIENLYDTLQSVQIDMEEKDVLQMEADALKLNHTYKGGK